MDSSVRDLPRVSSGSGFWERLTSKEVALGERYLEEFIAPGVCSIPREEVYT